MPLTRRQLVRIANTIRDQLLTLEESRQWQVHGKLNTAVDQVRRLESILRKLKLCKTHGWTAAAKRTMGQIGLTLRNIPFHTRDVESAIEACSPKVCSVNEICRELLQAEEEFGGLGYDKENDVLMVTTEPIELEGVHLGEFEIQLNLCSLAEIQQYDVFRIVALDPNPAAGNTDVTHPHVSDEHLCEGDAKAVIRMSLTTGRICDFFLLVRSVLTNYNPDSPYVALEKWDGIPCHECGYITNEADWCSSCENDFCYECCTACGQCNAVTCVGCVETCNACGEPICPGCMTRCADCGNSICTTCQNEKKCPCIEDKQENENDSDDGTQTEIEQSKEAETEAA